MPARMVFCERARELRGLRRGWRTPDPSPSREAKETPTYVTELRLCEDGSEAPAVPEVSRASEGGAAPCALCCGLDEPPTPRGHEVRRSSGAKSAVTECKSFYDCVRQRTPSPEVRYAHGLELCTGAVTPQSSLLQAPLPVPHLPASACSDSTAQDSSSEWGICPGDVPDKSPHNLTPEPFVLELAPFCGAAVHKGPAAWVVSRGSIGHPYTCGEPCKYAKKRRGCKEGAACNRCHICEWRRREWVSPMFPEQELPK